MANNKIKTLLKKYGVEKQQLYEIKEEKIKRVSFVDQKKQEKMILYLYK